MNAARGIAVQVENSIVQFASSVNNSINPQLIKSYASNSLHEMYMLICRGTKFVFFLLLVMAFPVFVEADYVLELWLTEVPDYAPLFL